MEYVQAAYPEMRVVDLHPGQVTETDMAAKAKAKGVEKDAHLNTLKGHIDDGMCPPSSTPSSSLTILY